MSERNINSSIKTALINNDDFSYAHLVKFERPFKLIDGETDTGANRYAYYTDGATDILFDDGSGNGAQTYRANRITSVGQYSETTKARATSMSLTLAAEDLGASVEIAGTLTTAGVFTPTTSVHNGELIDFVEEGFKEGDIIKFSYSNTTLRYVITGFTTNNTVITTARTGTDEQDSSFPGSNTTTTFTITQDSIELNAALMDRGVTATNTSNASPSFINREVFIHKIFIDPETGTLLGGNTSSVLIFKGIIASVNIDEAPTGTKVKWSLTSHWGDFEEVNGRLTTDEVHRALNANKIPQLDSAIRPEYAADLGFMHGETSLSAIANYKTQETRFRMKSKKRGGLAGLFGGKKYYQEEYQVDIQNEVDLNVHLQGKYLPVVYGVQRINGNPVFADTLNNNSKIIYTADAICEGEIHGLYNIYIDDVPLICTDDNDYDVRNVTNGSDKDNTQLQCFGRMSRGNTLNGKVWAGGTEQNAEQALWDAAIEQGINAREAVEAGIIHISDIKEYRDYVSVPGLTAGNASGLEHSSVYNISHPYTIQQQFMHGRPNQLASDMLVSVAEASNGVGSITVTSKGASYETRPTVTITGGGGSGATARAELGTASTDDANRIRSITITNRGSGYTSTPSVSIIGGGGGGARATANLGGFKRQTDYWSSDMPYWSPSHRLLDTAYSAMKFTIDADSTTIPEIEYVVKGKVLDCYNYDNSYVPDKALGASDDSSNFTEGDLVTVETSTNGSNWVVDTTGTQASNKFKIMHKWLFTTSRGTTQYRFRLDTTPNLGLVNGRATDKTRLRLKDGSGNYWHMLTWDHEIIGETTFPDDWVSAGSNISTTGAGVLTVSGISNANKTKIGTSNPTIQFYAPEWYTNTPGEASGLKYAILKGSWSGSGDANTLTFSGTNYSGVTFPNTIKIRNAKEFNMGSISRLANITDNTDILASSYTDSHSNTIFERGGQLHNLTTGESREIRAFGTGNTLLEIETPFLTPAYSNHKFKIDSTGADKRASSNPALQTLDFVMNKKYGRGLEEKDLDISSFVESAKLCDARSDITIKLANSPSGVQAGDVFEITENGSSGGVHVASGTVATGGVDVTNKTVTLTNVINKFAKKFAEHISFVPGDIVYTSAGNFFRASSAGSGSRTEPTATTSTLTLISGTVDIHKVSGSGSVNTLNMLKIGIPIDYSLYDSDWVKYWRYFGWEHQHQSEVTRHQTNFILDTGKSVFQNINALLTHFNGILSYENGKYVLAVETQENAPAINLNSTQENTNPYYIDETDVIGKIGVVDNSQKNGKNTIKASLADPQLNWGTRSVTFFNSDFLKADRNVVKTGSFPYTGITNYYNARINTEKELFQTRFSKEVSFELGPRAILLRPGQVISMTYKPFDWTNKLLRIENLNFKANCNVSVKCREYDDSIYEITKQQAASISEQTSAQYGLKRPEKPTISSASTNKIGSILLNWANSEDFIEGSDSTEIWTHSSDSLDDATLLTSVDNSSSYMYNAATNENVYFWIRHTRYSRGSTGNKQFIVFSDYNASAGTLGTALAISAGAQSVKLNPSTHVIDYSKVGTETTTVNFTTTPFNMSGTLFYQFLVGTETRENSQTTTFTLADHDDNSADTTSGNTNMTVNSTSNYGVGMRVVGPGIPEGTTISAVVDSTNLTLSAAATATASNILVNITDEPAVNDAPVVITVKVHQGSAVGGIVGQDSVSIFSVQDGQSAITSFLTNESHTVATATDGTGASFTGAGGTFKVFYGNQDITSNAKVTFSAATGTNVTGTINASSGVYTISNFSGSASNGSVVFSTLVKGSIIGGVDGTDDVTLSRTYSISKAIAGVNGTGSAGQNAKTVTLTASDYSIVYDKDGATPNPSTSTDITLTATATNFVDPYFKFTGDTSAGTTYETSYTNGTTGANQDTFTFQVPAAHFSDPRLVRVGVAEADANTAEIAFDTISIFAIKPGATGAEGDDGFTVICSNEAHTFPAASNGAISSFSGSGTDFEVFSGGTQLTGITSGTPSSGQFKVTANATGITAGSQSASSNKIVFADHSGMSNSTSIASIIYTINIENTTSVTKKQTFTKSVEGAIGDPGTAAFSGFLTNENTSAIAYQYITEFLLYTGTGGEFKTFSGTTELTSGVAYAVNSSTSQTKNGLTLTINASTGVYTLSGASWSTDSESFELTATKSGDVLTKTFSINKLVNQSKVEIIATGHQFAYDNASANPSPASVTLTANSFGYNLSPQYKWEKSTDAGSSFTTISNFSSTAAITVSAGAFSTGTELYKVTMKSNNTSIFGSNGISVDTDSVTIARVKDGATGGPGADGDNTAVVTLYRRSSNGTTAPSVINDTSTYTFSTGVLSNSNGLDNWSQAVPAGSALFLYTCNATAIGANGASTASVLTGDWSTPVVTTDPMVARSAFLRIYNNNNTFSRTEPTDTTSGTPYNFKTSILTIGSGGSSGWTQTQPTSKPYWQARVSVVESEFEGTQTVTYHKATRSGKMQEIDDDDFEPIFDDNSDKKFKFRFRGADSFTETTIPDRYSNDVISIDFDGVNPRLTRHGSTRVTATTPDTLKNDTIAIGADGVLSGIGTSNIKVNNAKTTFNELQGTKPPSDANKFAVAADSTEGRATFVTNGTSSTYDVFSELERTKLNRLRLGKLPNSDSLLLENSTASQAKADSAESAAKTQEADNRVTFPSNTTEGQFSFNIGSNSFTNNVFSSDERTKLNNLRAGTLPGGTGTLESTTGSQTKATAAQTAAATDATTKASAAETAAKAQEAANRVTFPTDNTEGQFTFKIGTNANVVNNVFSSDARTKLNRLRDGKIPTSDTINLESTTGSQTKATAAQTAAATDATTKAAAAQTAAATDATTKATAAETAAKAQEAANRVTFPTDNTEGQFTFKIGTNANVVNNVFSADERTKLNNLRAGTLPGGTGTLESTTGSQTKATAAQTAAATDATTKANTAETNAATTAQSKVDSRLSSTEKTRLNAGSSPDNTKSFDNAGTITGNVTGSVGGTAANTIKSGAASGATANQDSTATILAGDLTGSVNGTAVATIKSGAAAGATANQDSTGTILGGTHTGDVSGTIGGVANATIRGGVSRANSAIDANNRLVADIVDPSDSNNFFTRGELFRVRGGFDNIGSGALTLKQANLPTIPTSKGGTGVTDTAQFLNADITEAQLSSAGAVAASSLAYGEIAVSVGTAATSWSFSGTAYTPTATTQTVTLTISHPTFGTSTVVGTWTRTNTQITNFALGTATGMSGSGTNTWSFGDVDSDSGSGDNNFGSNTANNGLKTIYVQHSASNKRFEITAQVFTFTFTFKCLTPAMLPKNLQIGDEVDSPLGKTKVVDLVRKEREGYYILEDELEITNDHPILIDGEWILAEEYAGKKEYIDKPTEVVYVETENELLTVKDWTVGGKY